MLKSNFFSVKNFNIFYDFSREKNPTSAIRSPIKPRKFPIKPKKFPLKHLEIPRCFVFHPLYWAKKEEKAPCLGLSPLRQYKDNTFFREIQIALTFRNTSEMLKDEFCTYEGLQLRRSFGARNNQFGWVLNMHEMMPSVRAKQYPWPAIIYLSSYHTKAAPRKMEHFSETAHEGLVQGCVQGLQPKPFTLIQLKLNRLKAHVKGVYSFSGLKKRMR